MKTTECEAELVTVYEICATYIDSAGKECLEILSSDTEEHALEDYEQELADINSGEVDNVTELVLVKKQYHLLCETVLHKATWNR